MNPVVILTRNNLELTKRCVESVECQDSETIILIIDNGSTDGTHDWLRGVPDRVRAWWLNNTNRGVSFGWNAGLTHIFTGGAEHCLVINNDVILPPWFYSELLSYGEPFVTGVGVDDMAQITYKPQRMPLAPNPDFSAFLIRRSAWEAIGPFDEEMKLYASDCDYHVRGHRLMVGMWKANVPYYHLHSATLKNASPFERAEIEAQANADREVFRWKYGCIPGEPAYAQLFA